MNNYSYLYDPGFFYALLLSFVMSTVLLTPIFGLAFSWARKKKTKKIKPRLLVGYLMLGISILVFLAAQHIGWYGPLDSALSVSLFMAGPLFLSGLWAVLAGNKKWKISSRAIKNCIGVTALHAILATVFIFENSF